MEWPKKCQKERKDERRLSHGQNHRNHSDHSGYVFCRLGGFTYKTKEKVVEIGPIEATREKTHRVPIAPLAGGVAVAAGIGLLVLRKD